LKSSFFGITPSIQRTEGYTKKGTTSLHLNHILSYNEEGFKEFPQIASLHLILK